jgi:hypothetical protein
MVLLQALKNLAKFILSLAGQMNTGKRKLLGFLPPLHMKNNQPSGSGITPPIYKGGLINRC